MIKDKLKPCPFCGGEAEITKWHEGYFVECREQRCGGTIGAYKTEEEAIEAWNTRSERTCHKELMTTEDYTGTEVEFFGCSECGQWLSDTDCYGLGDGPNYCENCGCKVDSSFVTDEATGEVIYRDGEKVVE